MEQGWVFEDAAFRSCHAATIVPLDGGDLAAAWFGGSREGDPDVAIWMATARAGAGWSAPRVAADVDGVSCWNPVLHLTAAGELLLFYKAGSHPQTWSGLLRRSWDGGETWSTAELLPAGIVGPVKNKPVELGDGTLVCGSSVESYKAWGCWVERTSDAGRTWSKHGPITVAGGLHAAIQPALLEGGDTMAMLCRTRGIGRIARAESADAGRTWTDLAPIDLPHNNSGIDAVELSDGRSLLVYNHALTGRTPLNLGVSVDLGRTWTQGPVLEDADGEFSYPAVVQGDDGRVHIVYTWNRRRIRHALVRPEELPDPDPDPDPRSGAGCGAE